jgi:hypothetical protein
MVKEIIMPKLKTPKNDRYINQTDVIETIISSYDYHIDMFDFKNERYIATYMDCLK